METATVPAKNLRNTLAAQEWIEEGRQEGRMEGVRRQGKLHQPITSWRDLRKTNRQIAESSRHLCRKLGPAAGSHAVQHELRYCDNNLFHFTAMGLAISYTLSLADASPEEAHKRIVALHQDAALLDLPELGPLIELQCDPQLPSAGRF